MDVKTGHSYLMCCQRLLPFSHYLHTFLRYYCGHSSPGRLFYGPLMARRPTGTLGEQWGVWRLAASCIAHTHSWPCRRLHSRGSKCFSCNWSRALRLMDSRYHCNCSKSVKVHTKEVSKLYKTFTSSQRPMLEALWDQRREKRINKNSIIYATS